jgi:alpha-galactosidase
MRDEGNVARGGCTDEEYRTHFTLWCMLAAPLMMGCDVRTMDEPTRQMLTAPEVIAVNQDPLGRQATRLGREGGPDSPWHFAEVWKKPLADGSAAVAFFNRHDRRGRRMTVAWESLGIDDRRPCMVRDLWARQDEGVFTRAYSQAVEPHCCKLLKVSPRD